MREPHKDRIRLEHISTSADNIARYIKGKTYDDMMADDYYKLKLQTVWEVVQHDLPLLRSQVDRYLKEVNWDEWGKNEVVIKETATHKSLVQTAVRMKKDGLPTKQISRYTGLKEEEIINL